MMDGVLGVLGGACWLFLTWVGGVIGRYIGDAIYYSIDPTGPLMPTQYAATPSGEYGWVIGLMVTIYPAAVFCNDIFNDIRDWMHLRWPRLFDD